MTRERFFKKTSIALSVVLMLSVVFIIGSVAAQEIGGFNSAKAIGSLINGDNLVVGSNINGSEILIIGSTTTNSLPSSTKSFASVLPFIFIVAGIFAIWMLVKAEVDINVMLVVILAIVVILLLIAPVTSIFSKL